jgi:hypothetical protein
MITIDSDSRPPGADPLTEHVAHFACFGSRCTVIVQATALAPTATAAEALSKAALLSGPDGAAGWLVHGGVLVFDDGSHAVVDALAED